MSAKPPCTTDAGTVGDRAHDNERRRGLAATPLVGVSWVLLALSLSACSGGDIKDIVGTLVAGFLAAMLIGLVALLIIGGIAAVSFLISLVLLVLNLSGPSRLSVAGAGAFGVMFLGSGVSGGILLIGQATQQTTGQGDLVMMGVVWMMTHLAYAAALLGSSIKGHLTLTRGRARPA